MSEIIIDKIHTTPMGGERINKNLNLQTDDVVSWCKAAISAADFSVLPNKNWYVYKDDFVITVNAKSHTVITAHRAKNSNRAGHEDCLMIKDLK